MIYTYTSHAIIWIYICHLNKRDEKVKLALHINEMTKTTSYLKDKELFDVSMEIISDTKMESSEGIVTYHNI